MWIKNVRPRTQRPFNLPINCCVLLSAGLEDPDASIVASSSSRLQPAFVLFTTVGKLRGSRVIFQCSVSDRILHLKPLSRHPAACVGSRDAREEARCASTPTLSARRISAVGARQRSPGEEVWSGKVKHNLLANGDTTLEVPPLSDH